ncbi:MAG TPA: DNA polymerase I [Dehalococcoidia bacterium]|nr:DNA polymerase I [Dehalococcoidia bacterium]
MPTQKQLLLLFDGHALVHRAFHALPALAVTRTGEPTGAVYGFASMLLKVVSELKPTHWAVAFDSPAPTFRHKQFEAYKAHRPPAPEDLKRQFTRVRELVDAFNLPAFEVDGFEADDIIGTIARQASEQGVDTIIVTGDTDTFQLVSPQVRVLTPRPGKTFSDTIMYDEETIEQRYGLVPQQLADLRGLKGDPSDNIPGVPGVGEKTATKLLQQFESIDEIYEHIEEVAPEKTQKVLKENENEARQSKELATIVMDVPVTLDLDACRVSDYERDKVTGLFRELEFSSLLPKLPESIAEDAKSGQIETHAAKEATDYRVVDTTDGLDEVINTLSQTDSFAFDTETTGLDPRQASLVGFSLSTAPGKAWYLPVGHSSGDQLPLEQVVSRLKPLLENRKVFKIAHNGKYDMTVLLKYGVNVQNLGFDTMIAAYLLGEKSLGLKSLSFSKLGIEMTPISELIGTGAKQVSMAWVNIPRVAEYACADADMSNRLSRLLEAELKEQELWQLFTDVEMPLLPVILRMEINGVALDTSMLRDMSWKMGEKLAKVEEDIYKSVGKRFNINSTQQLGAVLFEQLQLPGMKKTKGGYSTSAQVLEELNRMEGAHPVIGLLLEYRQLSKLKSTYLDALPNLIDPQTGRIHTTFNQTGTTTGRLSSSDPNLQNIPVRTEEGRRVRKAFVAGKESALLLSADYSQIDLRALAHLSQDPILLDAFAHDEDIHATTAAQVFGVPLDDVTPDMRRLAKTVNFGVIYGMSEYGLEQATELSRQEAGQFIKAYFEKYSKVREYLDATKREAAGKGYVQTVLGRRRYIPEINSSNAQVRMAAERMAINMPVQGTSADIIKVAMIEIQREMDKKGLESKMVLQVHDELLFELPREEEKELKGLVQEIMPNAMKLSVPLKIDVRTGKNWDELK